MQHSLMAGCSYIIASARFWVALRETNQICAALLPRNEYAIFHPNSLEGSNESALRAARITANIQPG